MMSPSRNSTKRWEILGPRAGDLIDILLKNRGLKTKAEKREFFHPGDPEKLKLSNVGLTKKDMARVIKRIRKAKEKGEKVVVYGDYDADGISATAILWETLSAAGLSAAPFIPDRFSEGYGFSQSAIEKLKKENANLGLIFAVDHGITATKQIAYCQKLGIDVIICDHHQKQKPRPKAYAILHTVEICGAEIAWLLAREIRHRFKILPKKLLLGSGLDLAAIGVIADILPILGPNRSFAAFGIAALRKTKRPGLLRLYEEAGIKPGEITARQVGYLIAPRINAMGRLAHGLESLRLLCFRKDKNAQPQAFLVGDTNRKRQKIEEEVLIHAEKSLKGNLSEKIIVISDESYHEGVIGLAASRIVEAFHRPAVVISKKEKISKASARSISGFNIFEAIITLKDEFNIDGGGHAMAAGFSLETDKIDKFTEKLKELAEQKIGDDLLTKKIIIDAKITFQQINLELYEDLARFEPTGMGNFPPVFASSDVNVIEAGSVGAAQKHLKLKVEEGGIIFNAIAFEKGGLLTKLSPDKPIDIAYQINLNVWNGNRNLELTVKDIKF